MMFDELKPRAPDPLLDTARQFRADTRPHKLDLGVGVFQDEQRRTPILRTVKDAERILLESQETKTYLGSEGDIEFASRLGDLAFGALSHNGRFAALQSPGGTGALRLGAELIAAANPHAQVWLGVPTWPNHEPIFAAAGLAIRTYPHFDPHTQTIRLDALLAAMREAARGDVFVFHASCHNPTGADFSPDQWKEIARTLGARGLTPFLDSAYQGFAHGLEEDMRGAHTVLRAVPEALMAVSCSKNFGLYRERTGALFVMSANESAAESVRTNLSAIARANYSMPPDHGAAVVRTILADKVLRADWESELTEMRNNLRAIRERLAGLRINSLDLAPIARQNGMFTTLPLTPSQVMRLKDAFGIYMAPSGRINIAGLLAADLDSFAGAISAVLLDNAA